MMNAPAIDLAGRAGVAATAAPSIRRRARVLLGALLLALTPGLASAGAAEPQEWPTAPDQGQKTTTRIPWMRFSGDPSAPVLALAPGHAVHAHEVVVVREQELTRRQRRLLRRAERHAEKAARLRARTDHHHGPHSSYATVVVPVASSAPPAPPAPPAPVVVEHVRPQVQVVHLERAHEQEDCQEDGDESHRAAHEHEPPASVVIDVERLSADVQRQVDRALRDGERARERAERARERAERARERSLRDAEQAMNRGRPR